MLYDRWRQIARDHRDDLAVFESATGRSWTFGKLADDADRLDESNATAVFPSGTGARFVLDVLRGWRDRVIVCPLEPGQPAPDLDGLPPNCAHLKTTSASTGAARFVAFASEQLAADADNIVATMELRPDSPNIAAISLAHSYGFSNLITPLLLHGIPLVLFPGPLPETLRSAIRNFPNCTVPSVPALWRMWHDADCLSKRIRLAISAGAPLPVPLEAAVFERCGVKVHNFYGATECGGIAFDRTTVPRTDGACVGTALEGVQLSVSNESCLVVESAAAGETYWPAPAPALAHGRFETSDLAELRDGAVFLRGRASELVNVAGRKISPETIEGFLRRHPAVRECMVFGVPDESAGRGETPVACVALSTLVTAEALRAFMAATVPAWQVPRDFWIVDAIETNARGKLSRAEWRRRYCERNKSARQS